MPQAGTFPSITVRAGGRKELVALADGFHESCGSWVDVLRDAKRRSRLTLVTRLQQQRNVARS